MPGYGIADPNEGKGLFVRSSSNIEDLPNFSGAGLHDTVPNVKGEWIHPDAAPVEDLERLAHNCPSGAIRVERLDGGPNEATPIVNIVRIRENGPLAVNAALTIGEREAMRATLCRCGASVDKPFCDGTHSKAGFTNGSKAFSRKA